MPPIRVTVCNEAAPRGTGDFVLYWMVAARRVRANFALERAVAWARELGRPLVVLEALRCDHPWASERLHRFVVDGMLENRRALVRRGVGSHAYVEPEPGAGRGLIAALAARACVVVTDDFPCFFLPRAVAAAAARCPVRFEKVDANGLLPLRAAERAFPTAHAFRRLLQRVLPDHLAQPPRADPLAGPRLPPPPALPAALLGRWPQLGEERDIDLAALPIDHAVGPVAGVRGGAAAGRARLRSFVAEQLDDYARARHHPDAAATSLLSPWLHFGHLAAHEVFDAVAAHEGWGPERLAMTTSGSRSGWWGTSEPAESFLDQLVTWRELGFNFCAHRGDYDRWASLPDWARATLERHAADPRPQLYTPLQLEAAATEDPLWNAAQRELVQTGSMHGYLRMLWGKKILAWTVSPRDALAVMIELNNKYALDGRDPNSYAGIFWCLGRYDRAWGPERPIYGKVRYMTSASAARKLRLDRYLARYGAQARARG